MASKTQPAVFKVPKGEILWVKYVRQSDVTHIITSDEMRIWYYLYKVQDGKLIKVGKKSHSPSELEVHI